MLRLRPASDARVRAFLVQQQQQPFSYAEVGASRHGAPPGYSINTIRQRLGSGATVYASAVAALQRWTMFDLPWLRFHWPTTPIEPGAVVAVQARTYALWSLNACRVIYLIDEQDGDQRCGFGYGTLGAHVERGEERFTVEWRHSDDSVWYEIFAFAAPAHPLVRLAAPLARLAQRRFARDSAAAMLRAVAIGGS